MIFTDTTFSLVLKSCSHIYELITSGRYLLTSDFSIAGPKYSMNILGLNFGFNKGTVLLFKIKLHGDISTLYDTFNYLKNYFILLWWKIFCWNYEREISICTNSNRSFSSSSIEI